MVERFELMTSRSKTDINYNLEILGSSRMERNFYQTMTPYVCTDMGQPYPRYRDIKVKRLSTTGYKKNIFLYFLLMSDYNGDNLNLYTKE